MVWMRETVVSSLSLPSSPWTELALPVLWFLFVSTQEPRVLALSQDGNVEK